MTNDELREAVARAIYEAEPTTGHDDDEKPFIVPWPDIADQWCGYPATCEAMYALADAAIAAARPYIVAETVEKCARVAERCAFGVDIGEWLAMTKKDVSRRSCNEVAIQIRSMTND